MLNATYARPVPYLFSLDKYIILKECTYNPLRTNVINFSVLQPF
jgi:hypothetical protein